MQTPVVSSQPLFQDALHPWYSVERYPSGRLAVEPHRDAWPQPGPGQVLLQIVGAGLCGADIRVCTGNKASAHSDQPITLGHEGVGIVQAVGHGVQTLRVGSYGVVLPHVFCPGHQCSTAHVSAACIGAGHTLHRGWDLPGVFTDACLVDATHVVRIAGRHLHHVSSVAPALGPALFALTEPLTCVLTSYVLLEEHTRLLLHRRLSPGRALILGSGPIGILHALVLRRSGYDVWLADTLTARARLGRWCLAGKVRLYHGQTHLQGQFDLVVASASSGDAIHQAEQLVRPAGIVYLFAGLNSAERMLTGGPGQALSYERLHRSGAGYLCRIAGKTLLYAGHSGYEEHLFPQAIEIVAQEAPVLRRMVTGVIPGWTSSMIVPQPAGETPWMTDDGSPALLALLRGLDLRSRHAKILVCPTYTPQTQA